MDPKETLSQARRLQLRIDSRIRELRRLEDMTVYLSATDYSRPVVQHAASRGTVERIATMTGRADRLRDYLLQDLQQLEQQKLDAIGLISRVEDPRQADVLWEYYIRAARSWDDAARAVGYSRRQTLRLHGQALQHLRLALNGTVDPC